MTEQKKEIALNRMNELIDFTADLDENSINQDIQDLDLTNPTTLILEKPKTKKEETFFYLFDNPSQTAEQIMTACDYKKNEAFRQFVFREKENIIISKKDGAISFYDLSPQTRQKIQLRIDQKAKQFEAEQKERVRQQIKEEKKEEEILNIKSFINQNKIINRKENKIFLNLEELLELSPGIFKELNENPESTIDNFKIALRDFGYGGMPLRFSNFADIIEAKAIENLRNTDINKLVLIKARVSSLSDVRPQIVKIDFECPSCGTILPIPQIESKIKEPQRCSCGRKTGFKILKKKLVDRAKVELQDLVDLTESPQTREIKAFVKENLTESKELSKLNPGSEVKILCVLKGVEKTSGGAKLTSMDLYLNILEVEPFEEIIDLNSFEDEEIEQFREISSIISNENKLERVRESFAPDIIGNEKIKDTLILKQAQGRGRRNKSNIAFFSNPGLAKSVLVKKYHELMPGSSYVSGSGSSAVGLTATVEKKEDGWILKPGVLPTTKEDAIIDEFNLINEDERPKLQEAMSEGQLTINKASIHAKLKVQCGVIACANPINGIFNEDEEVTKQFNLTPQLLNRFDAVFIIHDAKNQEEDQKIAKQMILRNENKINQDLSNNFLKRFFLYIRNQPEPKFNNSIMEYISQKYSEIRTAMELNDETRLINARFIEAVIRLSKSMSKLKLNSTVSKSDVDFILGILRETYLNLDFSGGILVK